MLMKNISDVIIQRGEQTGLSGFTFRGKKENNQFSEQKEENILMWLINREPW